MTLLENYRSELKVLKSFQKELATIKTESQALQKDYDFNFFQLNEIKEAKLEGENIENLEEEVSTLIFEQKNLNIKRNLEDALKMLSKLSSIYKEGDIETKRQVIGSIYPEKLLFDGITYRTPRVNVIAQSILLINKALGDKKNRTNKSFSYLSGLVAKTGVEPVTSGL